MGYKLNMEVVSIEPNENSKLRKRNKSTEETDETDITDQSGLKTLPDHLSTWNKQNSKIMHCGGGSSVRMNPIGVLFICLVFVVLLYFNFGGSSQNVEHLRDKITTETVSLKALLSVSIEIAKRGGLEVKKIREQANIGEKSKGKTREGANNPVTDGDMLSHRAMYYGLQKAFPLVNIISEEDDVEEIAAASISNSEVDRIIPDSEDLILPAEDLDIWIDPLDATQEYTENLLNYVTTMVCVAVKGRPVLGVIHKPFNATTAWAWSGVSLSRGAQNYFSDAVQKDVKKLRCGG